MKKAAWAVGRGVLRIGASVATFGATEALSGIGDAVAEAVGDEAKTLINSSEGEKESEKFWNAHDARIAAMEAFRLALTELTEPDGDGEPQRKLVIVIDELDRCRPDYALSLLEIIKHFFNVPGVHFVLGVNLKELQNSVRARYGSGVDAVTYLQKFVSLTLKLSSGSGDNVPWHTISNYFWSASGAMGFPAETREFLEELLDHLQAVTAPREISLRDVERILALAAAQPENVGKLLYGYKFFVSSMIVLKAVDPDRYDLFRNKQPSWEEVQEAFRVREYDKNRQEPIGSWLWKLICTPDDLSTQEKRRTSSAFGLRGPSIHDNFLRYISDQYVEAFKLTLLNS